MLVKNENSIYIEYILPIPSHGKPANSFLHQHLRRYNLDAQALGNVMSDMTEMSRFLSISDA